MPTGRWCPCAAMHWPGATAYDSNLSQAEIARGCTLKESNRTIINGSGTVAKSPDNRDTSAIISLILLGGFRAERDGCAVPDSAWGRRSARSLLKLLALDPSHRLHREQIEATLWPDLTGTANTAF